MSTQETHIFVLVIQPISLYVYVSQLVSSGIYFDCSRNVIIKWKNIRPNKFYRCPEQLVKQSGLIKAMDREMA